MKSYAISGYEDYSVVLMMKERKPTWKYLGNNVNKADVVIFTGGADILPGWYNEKGIPGCYYSPQRDEVEARDFKSLRGDQQAWGICRGAQLAWALSGGKLWQDISDHAGYKHETIDTETGGIRMVNSVHHQQLMPITLAYRPGSPVTQAKIISHTYRARAKDGLINGHFIEWNRTEENKQSEEALDIEAVLIPETDLTPRVLGFQAHPEYGYKECTDYFFELVERYM